MTHVPTRALSVGVIDQRSCPGTRDQESAPTDPLQLLEGMPFDGDDFRERGMPTARRNLLGACKFLAISAGLAIATSSRLDSPGLIKTPLRIAAAGCALVGVVDIVGEAQQFAKDLGTDLQELIIESEEDWYS